MRPPAHRFGDLEAQGEGAERTYRWTCTCTKAGPWTTKSAAYEGMADHFMEHLPRMLLDRRVPPCPICQAPGGFHDAAPHAGSLVFGDTPAGWRQASVTPLVDGAVIHHYVDEDGRPHAVEVKV